MDNINKFKTIEEIENYRKQVNEACDNRADYIRMLNEASTLMDMSFPYLKESMDSFSKALFLTESGRVVIGKYTKAVKENKDLVRLFNLCENIKNANKSYDTSFFMNTILKEFQRNPINKESVEEGRKNVAKILAEGYAILGKEADGLLPEHDEDLDFAIKMISEQKPNLRKNFSDYNHAMMIIREKIESKEPKAKVYEVANLEELANRLINNFNDKYSSLTNEEKEVAKSIVANENKEEIFNKYKDVCVKKLEEEKNKYGADIQSKNKIESIIESVKMKSYTGENDINNLVEMIKIFE